MHTERHYIYTLVFPPCQYELRKLRHFRPNFAGLCKKCGPRRAVLFGFAFAQQLAQHHFPAGVAPARILGKIVRQLPRERRAVKIEVACLIHPVQLLRQIVLIIVALAAVGQVPVEGRE